MRGVPYVVVVGKGGGEERLLTDAVSKIHVVGGPKKYLVRINNKLD